MLLLPDGQTGEDWEPSKSNALSENGQLWVQKQFHLAFKRLVSQYVPLSETQDELTGARIRQQDLLATWF